IQNDFGVRRGAKLMAAALEFRPQFARVVAFAVIGDPELAVGAGHWHAPAIAQIDDGKTRIDEQARSQILHALAVRAAMLHGGSHKVGGRAQRLRRALRRDASNSTHEIDQASSGRCECSGPATLSFLDSHFYTYMEDAVLNRKRIPKRARIAARTGKESRRWRYRKSPGKLAQRSFCSGCSW